MTALLYKMYIKIHFYKTVEHILQDLRCTLQKKQYVKIVFVFLIHLSQPASYTYHRCTVGLCQELLSWLIEPHADKDVCFF